MRPRLREESDSRNEKKRMNAISRDINNECNFLYDTPQITDLWLIVSSKQRHHSHHILSGSRHKKSAYLVIGKLYYIQGSAQVLCQHVFFLELPPRHLCRCRQHRLRPLPPHLLTQYLNRMRLAQWVFYAMFCILNYSVFIPLYFFLLGPNSPTTSSQHEQYQNFGT